MIMATTPLKDAVVYLSTMTSLSRAFVSASKKTQLLQPSWMNCSRVLRMWHRRHARRFFVLSGMTIARVGGLGFSVCGLFAMCLDVSDTRSITSKKNHAFLFFFPLFSCFHSFPLILHMLTHETTKNVQQRVHLMLLPRLRRTKRKDDDE